MEPERGSLRASLYNKLITFKKNKTKQNAIAMQYPIKSEQEAVMASACCVKVVSGPLYTALALK